MGAALAMSTVSTGARSPPSPSTGRRRASTKSSASRRTICPACWALTRSVLTRRPCATRRSPTSGGDGRDHLVRSRGGAHEGAHLPAQPLLGVVLAGAAAAGLNRVERYRATY